MCSYIQITEHKWLSAYAFSVSSTVLQQLTIITGGVFSLEDVCLLTTLSDEAKQLRIEEKISDILNNQVGAY